jgi:hypothetical protein
MVYEAVRDVRRSVLQMRDPNDDDIDSDIDTHSNASTNKTTDTLNRDPSREAFKYNFQLRTRLIIF